MRGAPPPYCAAVPVPDFQTVMRPTLVALEDGTPHTLQQIREAVAAALGISEEVAVDVGGGGEPRVPQQLAGDRDVDAFCKQAGGCGVAKVVQRTLREMPALAASSFSRRSNIAALEWCAQTSGEEQVRVGPARRRQSLDGLLRSTPLQLRDGHRRQRDGCLAGGVFVFL